MESQSFSVLDKTHVFHCFREGGQILHRVLFLPSHREADLHLFPRDRDDRDQTVMSFLGGPHDPAHLTVCVFPDHKADLL